MLYALIKNQKVDSVIVADPEFIEIIQADWDHVEAVDTLHEQGLGVSPGWQYLNNEFVPPVVTPTQEVVATKITKLAFLNRFTDAEAVGIDLASIGNTVQAASMRRYLNKVNAASFIDLSRQDLREGVQALETAGILAVGRAAIILDGPVLDEERPV